MPNSIYNCIWYKKFRIHLNDCVILVLNSRQKVAI